MKKKIIRPEGPAKKIILLWFCPKKYLCPDQNSKPPPWISNGPCLINQKRKKVCESLPPPHFTIFTKIMYMYLYKEYYVEWGSWYKEGTMLQRQKKQKTN